MTPDCRRLLAICAFAAVAAATYPVAAQDAHPATEPSAAAPQAAPAPVQAPVAQAPSVTPAAQPPASQPAPSQPAPPQTAASATQQPTVAPSPASQAPTQAPAVAPPATPPAPPSTTSAAPPTDTASQPPAAPPVAVSLLPQNLSPWGMFLNADIVVKTVICALAFASILTWTIWLVKTLELAIAKRRLARAYRGIRGSRSLAETLEGPHATNVSVARALLQVAREELHQSADALDDRDGLKERIALHLQRVEAAIGRHMMVGTGILATIGSTAPFVGLFGTVWGIMNSFIGISKMHTTNLAVVAPGIAEALLATAIGLVAAIPAVVIYNHFARQISAYKAQVADAGSAVLRLASRDLSRGVSQEMSGSRMRMVAE